MPFDFPLYQISASQQSLIAQRKDILVQLMSVTIILSFCHIFARQPSLIAQCKGIPVQFICDIMSLLLFQTWLVSQGSWVRYPVWQHTFVSPSAFSRRALVRYWRKYVHKVLVNRLGGLSLPRKSVVRITDRPDMTLDVYRGRKTTMQQQQCKKSFPDIAKQPSVISQWRDTLKPNGEIHWKN